MISRGIDKRADCDCIVIGAGAVGAATAFELADRGLNVTVVDRAPSIGGGCSYANAALIAPGHVTPLATPALLREAPKQMLSRPPSVRIRPNRPLLTWLPALGVSAFAAESGVIRRELQELALESARLHEALAQRGLNPTLRKTGALDVFSHRPRRPPAGLLSPDQVHDMEPALARTEGAAFEPEEWTVESQSFVRAMLEGAADAGAHVQFSTTVDQLVREGDRVVGVRSGGRTILAGHVVLASGVDSAPLAAQAGIRAPLQGGRGYVIDFRLPDQPLSRPVRLKERRAVITPLADRVRVSGSLEFGTAAETIQRTEALRRVAAEALPQLLDAEVIDRWTGQRPCTPDGVPMIGPSRRATGLDLATGHGMWGLILAPVTAKIIADSVVSAPGSMPPPTWTDPDRFTRSAARPPHSLRPSAPRTLMA
ncbi:MAG TPA: FAD-dependent oxidoreductase [Candidatus Brachybacterium merdigallinarum]|nr:FAD-dependent oxidoreductase [Candidatus Brachybacterium merdigallinarum]